MKKHLKSVVSFVAALGVAASSVASMAAANYSDVAADAKYAEAVANLSAIGILTGDVDGTFRPEDNITRAEATAVVVRALAQEEAAKSAVGPTKFSDVASDHWASGYINIGSAGATAFINGVGNGLFAPGDNVTYAQIIKMLVASIGYNDMALGWGGWPTGYVTAAQTLGISEGITGINADAPATRGVVAQLTNNAINVPLMGIVDYRGITPRVEVMDGKNGRAYETALTKYHKIYTVEGRVIETNKTTSGGIDADKVRYQIENTKRYGEDGYVVERGNDYTWFSEDMYIGDTDAADYLNVYSKALVYVDDTDDAVILSILASGKNQTVTLDAKGFDDEEFADDEVSLSKMVDNGDKNQIYFYADGNKKGKSTRYYLAEDFTLYVNGVEIDYDDNYEEDNAIVKYIFNNDVGKVTLVDTPSEGNVSTDGKYDAIFVTYYATATVDTISSDKIYFDNTDPIVGSKSYIDFDWDDDDFSASFSMDGNKINYEDIKEGDVLSIAFDVSQKSISDSNFYDIIVSRNIVEGRVNEINDEDGEITIDNEIFSLIDGMTGTKDDKNGKWDVDVFKNNVGTSYTIYLDAFNRIVDSEKLASTIKYAIVHNVYEDNAGDRKVQIYDTTANSKTLDVDDKMSDTEWEALMALTTSSKDTQFTQDSVYESGTVKNAYEVEKRVITYTTNGKGELKSFENLYEKSCTATYDDYKVKSNKIGTLSIGESTVIIAFGGESKTDYNLVNKSNLIDGTDYMAYGYDKDNGVYPFIVIVDGVGSYNTDSRFAVVEKTTTGSKDNEDDCDKIHLYNAGSKDLQVINTNEKDIDVENVGHVIDLQKGDVIIYKTNASGEITDVELIFRAGSDSSIYDTFVSDNYGTWEKFEDFHKPDVWNPKEDTKADKDGANLIIGPVVDKSSNSVSIATDSDVDEDGWVNLDKVEEYDYASDIAIYVYDFNNAKNDRLYVGTSGSVIKKSIPKNAKDSDNDSLADLVEAESEYGIKFPIAIAKVIDDDEITDLLIIIPKD